MKIAMASMSALIVYLSLMQDMSLFGQFRLRHHDLSHYMKLDASALKALNLMPNPNELGGSKNMSLFGLLNKCKTSQGQRLLSRWLVQPLVNLHEICECQSGYMRLLMDSARRQGIVAALYDDRVSRDQLMVRECVQADDIA